MKEVVIRYSAQVKLNKVMEKDEVTPQDIWAFRKQ